MYYLDAKLKELDVVAAKKDAQDRLSKVFWQLEAKHSWLRSKSRQYEDQIAKNVENGIKDNQALQEPQECVESLLTALKHVLDATARDSTFFIKHNKLSSKSITKLENINTAIQQIVEAQAQWCPLYRKSQSSETHSDLSSSEGPSNPSEVGSEQLSKPVESLENRFQSAAALQYDVSKAKVWQRRMRLVAYAALMCAASTALVLVLMTPGVNLGAVLGSVGSAFFAMLAFVHLHKPVTATTNITVMNRDVPAQTPVPSSLGLFFQGLFLPLIMTHQKIQRMTIKPKREVAASHFQTKTVDILILELNQKIDALENRESLEERGDTANLLRQVVKEAKRLYSNGANSTFFEIQQGKLNKARAMLKATAKVLEDNPLSVEDVLKKKVEGQYTYKQVITAQRNTSTLFKTKQSTLQKTVCEHKYRELLDEKDKYGEQTTVSAIMAAAAA